MQTNEVRSVGVKGVASAEGWGNSQKSDSVLLQAFDAVYKVARRELGFCSLSAKDENRLWRRKNSRSFSECMRMRTKGHGLMSVRCSEWKHLPFNYIYSPTDTRTYANEAWMRTLRGSAISAVRHDEIISTVVLLPLTSRAHLPRRMIRNQFHTEPYVSGEDLQKIIRDHLVKGDDCLYIFTTEAKMRYVTSATSSECQATAFVSETGSQASASTTACASQATVPSSDCGSQASVPSEDCASQASMATVSCGCQATVKNISSGTQTHTKTAEFECQAVPVKVDVACQTDAVLTSDAQTDATNDNENTAVQTQDLVTRESEEERTGSPSIPGTFDFEKLPPLALVNPQSTDLFTDEDELHKSTLAADVTKYKHMTSSSEDIHKSNESNECCDVVLSGVAASRQELVYTEDDIEDMDAFTTNEYARLNAMTVELNNRSEFRNELSLADELAGLLADTSSEIKIISEDETSLSIYQDQDVDKPVVVNTDSNTSVDLVRQDDIQYSYTLPSGNMFLESFSESPSHIFNLSFSDDLTFANSNVSDNLPRNAINLADELALAMNESFKPTNTSVNICLNKDNPSYSTARESDSYGESSEDLANTRSRDSTENNINCSENNISDDVMLRVFGFDPSRSPFTVNGYPLLPYMTPTLDDLDLPILERKEVEFVRTDDGMFVSVGRGSYGCVYLANMAERNVVVKDYINQYVTWEVIQHEAQLLKYLSDTEYVPAFVGLIQSTASYAGYSLVQEYFGGGQTIFKLLTGKDNIRKTSWVSICCQLVDGLEAIHSKHVLLNDIKGDNVLVDLASEIPKVRYIDLGMATYRQGLKFEQSRPNIGVYEYLAPEVCMGSHSSPLSDIYSLGYLLAEIGRKSQISELLNLSDACTHPLPIERTSLTELRKHLDKLLKILEMEEEEEEKRGIVDSPNINDSCN